RREVSVASVILAPDMRELAQLLRGKHSVRNRNAQHRRMLLDIEAVLQPQRAKLVLGQLAGEKAPRLVAELRNSFGDDAMVEGVVAVHGYLLPRSLRAQTYVEKE